MTDDLFALLASARTMTADARARFATTVAAARTADTVLVETCHRVELYGIRREADAWVTANAWPEVNRLSGERVVHHLVRVAVGSDSAVMGEDQILHQLRLAIGRTRASGGVPVALDRLFDIALRAGRTARSWLPAGPRDLAGAALDRVTAGPPGRVLIVGAGNMGHLAGLAVRARGGEPVIANRTSQRAAELAKRLDAEVAAYLPGPLELRRFDGVVLAIAGRWPLPADSVDALVRTPAWVVDLSVPSALEASVRRALGVRLTSIDDLAAGEAIGSPRLRQRMEALVEDTVATYLAWASLAEQRDTARALRERAASVESAELADLLRRVPGFDATERAEIARAFSRLSDGLLRDPLERLNADDDGRRARAAQELFRL